MTDLMKACDVLLGIVDSVLFWWYHHLVQPNSPTTVVLHVKCLHYLWSLYKPSLKLGLGSLTKFYNKSCHGDLTEIAKEDV